MAGKNTSVGSSSGFTVDVKVLETQSDTIKNCSATLTSMVEAISAAAVNLPYDVASDADIKAALKKVVEALEKESKEIYEMGNALSTIQTNYINAENDILGIDDPIRRALLKLIGGGIGGSPTDSGTGPYGFDYDDPNHARKKKWSNKDEDSDGNGGKKNGDSDEDGDGNHKKNGDSDEDGDGNHKKNGDSDEDGDGNHKKNGDSDEDGDGNHKKNGDSDEDGNNNNGDSEDDSDNKKGVNKDIKYEKTVGVEKTAYEKKGSGSYGVASGEYDVKAGSVEAYAKAGASKNDGLYAGVGVAATGASASAKGKIGNDMIGVHGEATVTAASTAAYAQASVGKDGLSAGAEATAVLASAEGKAGVDVLGTDVDVVGSVGVGVGAKANVTVKGGKVSAEIGAYLGVGADIKVEIDVSGTVDMVVDGGKKAADWIGDKWNSFTNWF